MTAPSMISHRRLSASHRLRLQVLFARVWEALAETHQQQAAAFARRLAGRLPLDEAVRRYFRYVAVPAAMRETVRARALVTLAAEFEREAARQPVAEEPSWRPDELLERVRRRVRTAEEAHLTAQLAASLADEAVCVTHMWSAVECVELLRDVMPLDEALAYYVKSFDLPAVLAQMVFQRTLAQLAGRHPLLAGDPAAETVPDIVTQRARRRSGTLEPQFGLSAIG